MRSHAARVRADLQSRTGVDFAEYVDDDLVDSVTGWSGLLGIVGEAALSAGVGLLLIIGAVVAASTFDLSGDESAGLVIGGVVAGIGAAALTFAVRLRSRIPAEASKVFEVAGTAVDRVARDVASGRLTVTAGDAARGLTLVAAIPALTRAARRRFPVLGLVAAPAVGAVLSRTLGRVWPAGQGTASLSGLERPARRLEETLGTVGETALPRIATAVRWATLPLMAGGVVLAILGVTVILLSFSLN